MKNRPILRFTIIFCISLAGMHLFISWFHLKFENILVDYGNKLCFTHVTSKVQLGRVAGITYDEFSNGVSYLYIGTAQVINRLPNGNFNLDSIELNLMTFLYLPLILALSLVLATPFGYKKKIIGAGLAFILISGFIYLKFVLTLLTVNNCDLALVIGYSNFTINILSYLFDIFIGQTSLGSSIVVVIVLWISIITILSDIRKVFVPMIETNINQSKTGLKLIKQ
ncbi:MAG: hypothetical protein HW421_2142 [Ignavibacteria bacterium]|nr:hypothetical protein [Ignavibacteria bacterium]